MKPAAWNTFLPASGLQVSAVDISIRVRGFEVWSSRCDGRKPEASLQLCSLFIGFLM